MIKLAICNKHCNRWSIAIDQVCDHHLKFLVAKFFENVTINTKFHNLANFQAMAKCCTNLEMAYQAEFRYGKKGFNNSIGECCKTWLANIANSSWIRPKYLLGTLKAVLIGCVTNQGRYPNFLSKKTTAKCCKVWPKNCCKVWPKKSSAEKCSAEKYCKKQMRSNMNSQSSMHRPRNCCKIRPRKMFSNFGQENVAKSAKNVAKSAGTQLWSIFYLL